MKTFLLTVTVAITFAFVAFAINVKFAAKPDVAAVHVADSEIKGFSSEYIWDGVAADGSGKLMKNDPRIILFDDFSDYGGNLNAYVKGGADNSPKRWIGDIGRGLTLDSKEKFSGNYSLKVPIPQQSNAFGATISQWVDARALRGEPMNDEAMTARGGNVNNIPADGMPLVPGVNPKEGGFEEIYARAMIKYAEGFDRYGHNGIGYSGGYFNRPNPGAGSGPAHPGSSAGYRSNGFDRWTAHAEPEHSLSQAGSTRPGYLNIYFYGVEQIGIHGNHYFSNGQVIPSTGGDGTRPLNRTDGTNGFKALPNFKMPVGEWFCMEFYVKLNTVIQNGVSPGPNHYYSPGTSGVGNQINNAEKGSTHGIGPQPAPNNAKILADGVFKVWINGKLALCYEDIIIRHTNTMIIDYVSFFTYFGNNSASATSIWWDNLVVATEYIGAVNTSVSQFP